MHVSDFGYNYSVNIPEYLRLETIGFWLDDNV